MSTPQLLFALKYGERPLAEILFDLGSGAFIAPRSPVTAAERWMWLADLLTHSDWGMTAIVSDIDETCARLLPRHRGDQHRGCHFSLHRYRHRTRGQ